MAAQSVGFDDPPVGKEFLKYGLGGTWGKVVLIKLPCSSSCRKRLFAIISPKGQGRVTERENEAVSMN